MNIDKIEILVNDISFTILPKENKLIKKDKITTISDEEISYLISIIRTWKSNYYNNKYFDGNVFEIKVHSNDKVDIIRGTRNLPENYEEFSKLVRSLYGRR